MTYTQPDLFGANHTVVLAGPTQALRNDIAALIRLHGFDKVEEVVGQWKVEHGGPIPSAPARHEDPRTSVGGRMGDVRKFGRNSYAGRLLTQFSMGEYTDAEATIRVLGEPGPSVPFSKWEGCRRRCSDLRAAGYIADTGAERDSRIVWSITLAGEVALDNLLLKGWSR